MQELINALEQSPTADYLLDTCFLLHMIEKGHTHQLTDFCRANKVGMSSFNLAELDKVHHRLDGTIKHHIRDFLKQKAVSCVPVGVEPGDWEGERNYVRGFDDKMLKLVPDASDAVLLVLALKINANVLTRDKHHIFTTLAENYIKYYGIEVLNGLPGNKEDQKNKRLKF